MGLDLSLGLRSGATSWRRVGLRQLQAYSRLFQYSSLFGLHWLAWLSRSDFGSVVKMFTSSLVASRVQRGAGYPGSKGITSNPRTGRLMSGRGGPGVCRRGLGSLVSISVNVSFGGEVLADVTDQEGLGFR